MTIGDLAAGLVAGPKTVIAPACIVQLLVNNHGSDLLLAKGQHSLPVESKTFAATMD
jgi:hypothetical protein